MQAVLEHFPGCAGADEAGRGPLAGPIVAAAVILPEGFDVTGLDDSKKLKPHQRVEQAARIRQAACFTIEISEVEEVDRLNILWASMAAMKRALQRLAISPCRVYVDGDRSPQDLPWPCEAVVKGDSKVACIAAASIIAKTTRDEIMTRYAEEFPGYGFENHFGYATPEHMEALRMLGPSPIHRRTFAPIREMLEQPCLDLG